MTYWGVDDVQREYERLLGLGATACEEPHNVGGELVHRFGGNNDNDNSAGMGVGSDRPYIESYEGRLIDAKGATGRYVRLYSNGSTADGMNHYIEVEVFGKPVG